jgi:hypothetical protein
MMYGCTNIYPHQSTTYKLHARVWHTTNSIRRLDVEWWGTNIKKESEQVVSDRLLYKIPIMSHDTNNFVLKNDGERYFFMHIIRYKKNKITIVDNILVIADFEKDYSVELSEVFRTSKTTKPYSLFASWDCKKSRLKIMVDGVHKGNPLHLNQSYHLPDLLSEKKEFRAVLEISGSDLDNGL